MGEVLMEFELAQAKVAMQQQAILASIQSGATVATNCHFIHEAKADVKREQLFADEKDEDEESAFRPAVNDDKAGGSGKEVIDICDDK